MSSYSRMVVIPQEEYMQMSAIQQVRQPLTQQFYNTEQDYQKNLHSTDPQRTVLLQSETIERLKDLKDQMRAYLTISTPRPYRTRAEALFQSIEPHLNVNEKGEVIKDDNSVIEASRFEDLIQHAVRDRRRNFKPTGWDYFVELLRKHNVPRSSLNRETLDELSSARLKTPLPSKLPMPKTYKTPKFSKGSKIPVPVTPMTFKLEADEASTLKQKKRRSRSVSRRKRTAPSKFMFAEY